MYISQWKSLNTHCIPIAPNQFGDGEYHHTIPILLGERMSFSDNLQQPSKTLESTMRHGFTTV